MAGDVLEGENPEQADMMDEMCILVDEEDRPIGSASKLDCHRGAGLRHRAFSVLIFETKTVFFSKKGPVTKSPSQVYGQTRAVVTH